MHLLRLLTRLYLLRLALWHHKARRRVLWALDRMLRKVGA
jgi:hypothetical protein